MNVRQKGQRSVRKCLNDLKFDKWQCEGVERVGRFVKEKDLFGLWDVMAIKRHRTKLIQVKTNKKPPFDKFMTFQKAYPQFQCEVWVWKDRKGFDKYWLWNGDK